MIFCLYSSARFSDPKHLSSFVGDYNEHGEGFLLRHSLTSKTSGTTAAAGRLLPGSWCDSSSQHPTYAWFERVCSFSNLADSPSRGKANEVALKFGVQAEELVVTPDLHSYFVL
eukprot:2932450-Amphidinium_carterae.1